MKRFVCGAVLGLAVCLATGCSNGPVPPPPAAATPADAFTRLAADHVRVQVRWMPEMTVLARLPLPQNRLPAIAPQAVALRLAAARTAAQQTAALPAAALSPAAREALALFLRDRQEELAGARFPEELLPLSAADGGFALWATTAPGRGEVLLETAADHEAWLQVLQQVPAWVEAALVNFDQLEARGLALAPEAWRSLAAQVARAAAAELVPPAGAWGSLPAATQQALARRYAALAQEQLRPALARLQQRLELAASRARGTPVWADLPLGEAWYAYRLHRATGLSLTPQQWHDAALAEMARLEALQAALAAPTPRDDGAPSSGESVVREPLPWVEVPAWQRLVPHVAHRDGYELYRLRARADVQAAALAEVRDSLALLVIDTGLHGLGWNREQALAYLAAHSRWQGAAALDRLGAVLGSSAWVAAPAAAALRLWQLRQSVAAQQGLAFDEAAFDAQLGAWGPLPLEVLETRMRSWAATQPALTTSVPTAP
jgi:uncharacterized protein (DUF885 family)